MEGRDAPSEVLSTPSKMVSVYLCCSPDGKSNLLLHRSSVRDTSNTYNVFVLVIFGTITYKHFYNCQWIQGTPFGKTKQNKTKL